MKESIKILIDWGGTIVRDHVLFNRIAMQSNNYKTKWINPDSWDLVRQLGSENFFEKNTRNFFSMGETYSESIETINEFCGDSGHTSEYETFIVYDNKPTLNLPPNEIIKLLAFDINKRCGKVNGIYVDSDKTRLSKTNAIDIVIEDDPRIAISLCLSGFFCILLNRNWNKSFSWENLRITIKSEKFEKITKKLIIAEDWGDVKNMIPLLTDGIKQSK